MQPALAPSRSTLRHVLAGLLAVLWLVLPAMAQAQVLRPYVLAAEEIGSVADLTATTKAKLSEAGFAVVGAYSPRPGSQVIAFTSSALKQAAASSTHGGFGAVMRASVTEVDGGVVQVAFTNPPYWGNAYRLGQSLAPVRAKLAAALGDEREFGSNKGLDAASLKRYRYMMAMPRFDDQFVVAVHGSHEEALEVVRGNLESRKAGTVKVYEVAVPGRDAVIFGVGVPQGKGADSVVLGKCDLKPEKATAYAPYELLVEGGNVRMLHGRFRIALSFPDLGMGTFMKIVNAPPSLKEAMTEVGGG